MPNATGYTLLFPPEVTSDEVSVIVVALVGGDGLDAPLTVTPAGGSSVAFSGPVTIPPGSTSGSTTFRATGAGGSATISASHSGGNVELIDPGSASLTIHAPVTDTPAAATYYSASVVSPPPGYSQPIDGDVYPFARTGPVGQAQIVYVRVAPGTVLAAPLVVTLADDAGGTFVGNPLTISGSPGYGLMGYIPAVGYASARRTITVNATGGGGIGHYPVNLGLGLTGNLTFNAI